MLSATKAFVATGTINFQVSSSSYRNSNGINRTAFSPEFGQLNALHVLDLNNNIRGSTADTLSKVNHLTENTCFSIIVK